MNEKDRKLIEVSKLLKKNIEMLGSTLEDKQKKKNMKVIRDFIDKVTGNRIDNYIQNLEEQTSEV